MEIKSGLYDRVVTVFLTVLHGAEAWGVRVAERRR